MPDTASLVAPAPVARKGIVHDLPFADYLAAWIVDAATEYTATTESPTAQRSGMSARML